jgi:hypothetical protein
VADGWCWFVLREEYCWLVAGGWFVLREKYCWLVPDKPSEQADSLKNCIQRLLYFLRNRPSRYPSIPHISTSSFHLRITFFSFALPPHLSNGKLTSPADYSFMASNLLSSL